MYWMEPSFWGLPVMASTWCIKRRGQACKSIDNNIFHKLYSRESLRNIQPICLQLQDGFHEPPTYTLWQTLFNYDFYSDSYLEYCYEGRMAKSLQDSIVCRYHLSGFSE